MKRIPLIALIIIFSVGLGFAQGGSTVTRSGIKFQIKNLGINTGGTIGGVKATIHFNPAQLETSSIEATADVATINTDNDERDTHLKSADFFEVQRYPHITMKSVSFKHKSGANYVGRFNVTIKDKTKPFDVPFTYTENGNTAAITGTLKLNRLDFGVGSSSLVLSNDVTATITVEMNK
ncbi:YceI family protein [Mucilaginibacter calamicampi]|uniref:YceI family protein n=1 Tax=Mucilaginibacter calamicampi TaxID=1302352 RepID=A0ABW2Z0Y3_9SPHI